MLIYNLLLPLAALASLVTLVTASLVFDMDVRTPTLGDFNLKKVHHNRLAKRVVTDQESITVDESLIRIKLRTGAGHILNAPLLLSNSLTWFFGSDNGGNIKQAMVYEKGGLNVTDAYGHDMVGRSWWGRSFNADYWTDKLTFGQGTSPKDFVFGRAINASTSMTPGVGLGPKEQLTQVINGSTYTTSFLQGLVNAGYIDRRAFAMYLGANSTMVQPNIIFGGVDLNMIRGNWSTFPLLYEAASSTQERYFIALTGLSVTRNDNSVQSIDMPGDVPVMLDPQFSMSFIPETSMINLAMMLGAVYFDGLGTWICDCGLRQVGAFINIQLSNVTFSMSVYDALVPITDGFGKPVNFSEGGQACAVTFSSSEFTGFNVLGYNFLKDLYTVFDVDSKQVSIARLRKRAVASKRYVPDIKALRGPLGTVTNVTTIDQPDIKYTYSTPQYNSSRYTSTGGNKLTQVVLSDPTGVVTYEGITVLPTNAPSLSEPLSIDVSVSSTSSRPAAMIQLYGTPLSGSHTFFKNVLPTSTTVRSTQVPPTGIGAPRSAGAKLDCSLALVGVGFLLHFLH